LYLDSYSRSPKKLGLKKQEPFMVLQTDGYRFLIQSSRGIRMVSSDHVTGAPTPPARDAKWTRASKAQAPFKEGTQHADSPEFVFDRFIKHGWNAHGQLKLLVKWIGIPGKEDTWQFVSSISRKVLSNYWRQKEIEFPVLTREGVYFSDQVKKRVHYRQIARAGIETRVTKKRG